MRDVDVTHCQWAHCDRETLAPGIHYCRAHARVGRAAEDRAAYAMLDYADALPPSERKALWASIDADKAWRRRWWEPKPSRRFRLAIPWGVKRLVALRFGGRCGAVVSVMCPLCGARGEIHWNRDVPRFVGMHIDHIRPVSRGGGNEPENLRLLCPDCNVSRGNQWEG